MILGSKGLHLMGSNSCWTRIDVPGWSRLAEDFHVSTAVILCHWPPGMGQHSGGAGCGGGECEVDWWMHRREGGAGSTLLEACFPRGGLE